MLHPIENKCDAIKNLESPKTLRQTLQIHLVIKM